MRKTNLFINVLIASMALLLHVGVNAQPNIDQNYILVNTLMQVGVATESQANTLPVSSGKAQTVSYFDGLGRPLQNVATQATPSMRDIITGIEYDSYGREVKKYLPYASTYAYPAGGYRSDWNTNQSAFYNGQLQAVDADAAPYSLSVLESSPLNRPLAQGAPGLTWQPDQANPYNSDSRSTKFQYLTNTVSDSVRIWNIDMAIGSIPVSTTNYNSGQLYKNATIDEQNHQMVEYKDKDGRVILKKVQLSNTPGTAHVGWLCTYYVYDDLDNLRFVIQPKAVDQLQLAGTWDLNSVTNLVKELCFRYEYDERKRMTIKKVPGAAEVWMVYDARDRVVMTQDSLQRAGGKWVTNEYDNLNRVWRTTLLTDNHDRAYHQNLAGTSTAYPNMSGATYEVIKQLYYDDYSWVFSPLTSTLDATNVNNATYFYTSYNASPVYAQSITPNYQTRGMLTGQKAEVLNTNMVQNLSSVFFYDDRGRLIQRQSTNNVAGKDIMTTQYDFSGKVVRSLLNHNKSAGSFQTRTVVTRNSYDAAGRITSIVKKIDNLPDQTIATYSYNELGQLQNKQLGNNMENLAYTYNIRGWLKTINKDYVSGSANGNYFGMELAYDKNTSVNTATTYTNPQFNGNIAGTMWKAAGDGVARKYDFTYDNLNRLTGADFNQQSGTGFDRLAGIDFSVSGLSYDANGNILTMNQNGYKAGLSAPIDQLNYTYQPASNKLQQVTDGANDFTTKLGDFRYDNSTKSATDYTYDGNGNLKTDNNKNITSIAYFLYNGMPQQVKMKGKGTITYQYDADGNKLLETTVDSTVNPVKTFVKVYVEGFVYEGLQFQTDTFTYVSHEEGRARWAYHKYLNGTTKYGFEYDYFIKDHLGNTRVILTQQKDTARYLASMEAAYRNTETQLFNNITTTGYQRSLVSGYPNDVTYTNPNDSVSRLNGNGPKVGPSLLLKVMSGDKVDLSVQSYYNGTGTPNTPSSSFTDVLNSLVNGIVSASGGAKGTATELLNSGGPVYGGLNNFLTNNNPNTSGKPKAYLNWILLDEQLKYVSSYPQSNAIPVGASATLNTLGYTGLSITKSGYLYIWVSNETPAWDVFFDNLRVNHYAGPLLEETHYYPFGLTMAAISDQALKPLYYENKKRFQGQELLNKEFSDGSGLEMYSFKYRMDDPQIGRFWQIDPLADKYVYNSTYAFSENKVTGHIELEGLETVEANDIRNPAIRAAFRADVQKQVANFNSNASGAAQVKVSVGVGGGFKAQVGDNGVKVEANGPQVSVKTDLGGNTMAEGSTASVTVKAGVGPLSGEATAKVGTVEVKDGKVDANIGKVEGGIGTNPLTKTVGSEQDKPSGTLSTNPLNQTVTVGLKAGVVGVEASGNLAKAGMAVVNFFGAMYEYVKERIKENLPDTNGGYINTHKQ